MKKSICIEKIFLEKESFYDRFKCVADAGYDYLEFACWSNRDVKRIKELCEQFNLKIACFSGDCKASIIIPEEREEFLDYLGKSIETANYLGVKNLVIHSQAMDEFGAFTSVGLELDDVTKIASATRTMYEAAKMAEAGGVTLVMEAVNNISKKGYYMTKTIYTGNICKIINSPNLKILYDIWHMQQMEGNMVTTLRKYADVLGYLHIGDCPERHEPGTGEINFNKIKKVVIDELHYDGFWGFELDPEIDSDTCVDRIRQF